jgi:hypothetical protein
LNVKPGQIAHLDHDNTNDDLDNLAFLCFSHHDQYDSTTSQSKGLREGEVKGFRKELYDRIVGGLLDERVSAESKPRLANPVSEKPGQVARAEDKQEILPNIGSLRPQTIHVTHDDESDIWLKSNLMEGEVNDFVGIVLPFSNDPQPGKRTLPVDGLRARITYYRGDNVHEFKRVEGAGWDKPTDPSI